MRRRLAITVALAGALAPVTQAQTTNTAQVSSSIIWSIPDEAFGGWSAIEVDDDGVGFTVVSDRGLITSGRLIRNESGRLIGADAGPILSLTHTDGEPLPRFYDDSEGLAIGSDGRVFVSFEGVHRVMAYADRNVDIAEDLPRADDFATMQTNSSLEALAVGPDGAIYTLPERSGEMDRPFPVYRLKDGEWTVPFSIPRRGEFLAVGADIGPDGKFYLLERDLSTSSLGFASRVRRFDLSDNALTNEVTLFTSMPRTHDNLEGIAVWMDELEQIRLVMIADDNHRFFQKNEIVEYIVTPDPFAPTEPSPIEGVDPGEENL